MIIYYIFNITHKTFDDIEKVLITKDHTFVKISFGGFLVGM